MTVDALRGGSVDVLDVLLDKYGRELQRVAFLILRDAAAAEDVVVDTLMTALERGASLRDAGALRPWLLRIAANHALQHRRRGIRVVPLDLRPESTDIRDRTDAADRAALWQAIAALPPRTRAAIVLRYYADLPVVDVAAALGVSANTVKSQLKSGLEHLRSGLADAPTTLPEVPNA
jgi:RNA polymerase sigma-70 factor (ECF subfamily)